MKITLTNKGVENSKQLVDFIERMGVGESFINPAAFGKSVGDVQLIPAQDNAYYLMFKEGKYLVVLKFSKESKLSYAMVKTNKVLRKLYTELIQQNPSAFVNLIIDNKDVLSSDLFKVLALRSTILKPSTKLREIFDKMQFSKKFSKLPVDMEVTYSVSLTSK